MLLSTTSFDSRFLGRWTTTLIIGGLLSGSVGCSGGEHKSDTGAAPVDIASIELLGVTPTPDFAENGKVVFSVLPFDEDGKIVLRTDFEVEITVETLEATLSWGFESELDASEVAFEVLDKVANEPDDRQLACALDVDSSGSMMWTDPSRLRVDAAKDFVETLSDLRSDSEYGIFTFRGTDEAFEDTELLQDFTNDVDAASVAIEQVRENTDTPLYGSAMEVIEYTDGARNATDHQRVLTLLSDGQPTDSGSDEVISLASSLGIPIYTIGFGSASQTSPQANPSAVAVMQELASATGGAYASADSAEELSDIFERVATGIAVGSVDIPAETATIPSSGTTVSGTLTIDGTELEWSFLIP